MNKKTSKFRWIILGGLILFLRLPSLFEPFSYGDEGIYLTLGQAIKKGLLLYRDIHDNKPPLLYLLAALAGNFSFYRLILFFWSFLTIFSFYKLAKIFLTNSSLIIATSTFAILTSIRTFEDNIGNAENFMLLPTILGFFLYFKYFKSKSLWCCFACGVLFSLAALFKIPAAFDFLALLVLVFVLTPKTNQKLIKKYWGLIFGFSLPILASLFYFLLKNSLSEYLTAAFLQNIPYLSSWVANKPKAAGLPLPLLFRTSLVFLTSFGVFLKRKKISVLSKLIIIWFSFSLFAALLSSRPYPHYLLQVIPSLSLSFGLAFPSRSQKILPFFLFPIFIFSFLWFKFWYYQNLSYYLNFYQFFLKQKTKEEYFNYFGNYPQAIYQTATFLKAHTSPQEKIFLWTNHPSIYSLADRLPVGRYTVAYHIIDFNGYRETIKTLKQFPPPYIVVDNSLDKNFPELFSFLEQHYILINQFGMFKIFKKIC